MESKKINLFVVLIVGVLYFIEGVYLLHCPRYTKEEALGNNLLNDRALCRVVKLRNDEDICLNGYISVGRYCATGNCNIFGYNCDGHCLTGDDNRDENDDYMLKCDSTTFLERENVCAYYKDLFDTYNTKSKTMESESLPLTRNGVEITGLYGWVNSKSLEDNMRTVCPWNYHLKHNI